MAGAAGFPTDFFGTFPEGAYLPENPTGCDAVVEDGGEGIGPETLGGTWYPFVKPSADIRHILADACLTLPAPGVIYSHPLRIVWLSGFNAYFGQCASPTLPTSPPAEPGGNVAAFDSNLTLPTYTQKNGADVVIYDAANQVVFDSTTSTQYLTSAYGPRLRVHQWTLSDRVLRITQHTGFANLEVAYQVPAVITPARAVLDERVSEYATVSVTGITLNGVSGTATGDVTFNGFWNIGISPTTPSTAGTNTIVNSSALLFVTVPNYGIGRAPAKCDEQNLPITTLGETAPNTYGAFSLAGDPCYWVRPVVTFQNSLATIAPNQFQIGNDCSPCCDCSDYAATGTGLNAVFTQFQTVGAQAETVRDSFQSGVDRWLTLYNHQVPMSIQGNFLVNHTQYLDGVIQLCNSSSACINAFGPQVTLSLSQSGVSNPTIQYLFVPTTLYISNPCGDMQPCPLWVTQSDITSPTIPGYVVYTPDGLGNPSIWNITYGQIQPRSFGRFRFRLQFVGLDLTKPTTLTITVNLASDPPFTKSFNVQIV